LAPQDHARAYNQPPRDQCEYGDPYEYGRSRGRYEDEHGAYGGKPQAPRPPGHSGDRYIGEDGRPRHLSVEEFKDQIPLEHAWLETMFPPTPLDRPCQKWDLRPLINAPSLALEKFTTLAQFFASVENLLMMCNGTGQGSYITVWQEQNFVGKLLEKHLPAKDFYGAVIKEADPRTKTIRNIWFRACELFPEKSTAIFDDVRKWTKYEPCKAGTPLIEALRRYESVATKVNKVLEPASEVDRILALQELQERVAIPHQTLVEICRQYRTLIPTWAMILAEAEMKRNLQTIALPPSVPRPKINTIDASAVAAAGADTLVHAVHTPEVDADGTAWHDPDEVNALSKGKGKGGKGRLCYRCLKPGHIAKDCSFKGTACWNCKLLFEPDDKAAHFAKDCPQPKEARMLFQQFARNRRSAKGKGKKGRFVLNFIDDEGEVFCAEAEDDDDSAGFHSGPVPTTGPQ